MSSYTDKDDLSNERQNAHRTLTEQILIEIFSIGSWQYKFMSNLFLLLLAMRGRYNFCNMSQWRSTVESTFRDNYGRTFTWLEFDGLLCE